MYEKNISKTFVTGRGIVPTYIQQVTYPPFFINYGLSGKSKNTNSVVSGGSETLRRGGGDTNLKPVYPFLRFLTNQTKVACKSFFSCTIIHARLSACYWLHGSLALLRH